MFSFFSKSRRRESVAAFANILWVEQLKPPARTVPDSERSGESRNRPLEGLACGADWLRANNHGCTSNSQ